MEKKKPLVLVVEDDCGLQKMIAGILEDHADVVAVKSYHAAAKAICEHGDKIVGVTLDYNILMYEEETKKAVSEGLPRLIRRECGDIPIFAASALARKEDEGGKYDYNARLVALGCIPGGKQKAPQLLCDYIASREWV